jgi:hypothetical protein
VTAGRIVRCQFRVSRESMERGTHRFSHFLGHSVAMATIRMGIMIS